MKVLVLNCGSSSIKYKLFDMTSGEVMAQGGIEKIGLPGAFLKLTDKDGMAASRNITKSTLSATVWYMEVKSSLPA